MSENDVFGEDFVEFYIETMGEWSVDNIWPFLVEFVRRKCPDAETWLDLCCGHGELLRRVLDSGYSATGVDRSTSQLERARRTAPEATYAEADVRDFDLDATFDIVTSTFSSLDYLVLDNDILAAFRMARRHVSPKGVFVFDVSTPLGFDRPARMSVKRTPEHVMTSEYVYEPETQLRRIVFNFFSREEDGRYRRSEEEHVQRGYETDHVRRLLALAGFDVHILDGKDFAPVRDDSERIVCIAMPVPSPEERPSP